MTKYFYDSYAIIEYISGNPKYEHYFTNREGVTTLYNLMEVYYTIIRDAGRRKAKQVLEILQRLVVQPNIEDVEHSMNFRYLNKDKKFSYADCLGYVMAKRHHMKFLTGDKAFKDMQNVEHVQS